MRHPLYQFNYCPVCGAKAFVENNEKSKRCESCGFVYYFNPSSSVACFIRDEAGRLLLVRRGKEPAKGTLDLPGGFVDMNESGEQAAAREVREETGLAIGNCRYLFSLPNIYPYCGFNVHTLDQFFECHVKSFDGACAADDAAAIELVSPGDLEESAFGLDSVSRGVALYKRLLEEGRLDY